MKRFNTVKAKQLLVFLMMIVFLLVFTGSMFYAIEQFAIHVIYRQMESQAEYYVSSVDTQMEEILRQQASFFADRRLLFLVDETMLEDYERRDALLSVQEKLFIMISSNSLLKDAALYISGSGYMVTPTKIQKMDEGTSAALSEMNGRLGVLINKEGDLLYALSEMPYAESVVPNFYLQVVLDKEQFIGRLNDFTLEDGGSCWCYPEIDWFLEDTAGTGKSEAVLKAMQNADGLEEVRIGRESYLVNVTGSRYFGRLIQYCSRGTLLEEWEKYTWIFYGFIVLAIASAVMFSMYTERLINKPLRRLYEAFQNLQGGNMEVRVSHSSGDEFEYIYEGFNHMVQELQRMIEEVYEQKNLADRAELKQLQTQISPHFLYNSFFLFSGRVGRGDYEGAGELADYLGIYFRYLTRNTSDIVELASEMEHAEAYARIQESRFSSRLQLIWEPLPESAGRIKVPRLIIQPILENAYKHGLEDKAEDGILRVRYACDEENGIFCIFIEDNGNADEQAIRRIQDRLSADYKGEVTGIINIHRRLTIYFKQEGGLLVSKSEMGGVLVTIKLPYETGDRKSNDPTADCR